MKAQKKNKIAVLTSHFPSVSETFVVNHITGLIDAGFDVSILARKKLSVAKGSQPEIMATYNLIEKTTAIFPQGTDSASNKIGALVTWLLNNPLKFATFFNVLTGSKKARSAWIKNVRLVQAFKKVNGFDFYHAHFGANGLHLATMHKKGLITAPIAVTFHGIGAHPEKGIAAFKRAHEYLFTVAAFFTVNSAYLQHKLIALGCPAAKINIIPIAVDTVFFNFAVRKNSDVIQLVSVGRLIPLKGHEYALKAVKLLVSKGHKLHYVIVGDGESKQFLTDLIIKLNLEKYVQLVGRKNQAEIRHILHKSDIFVMPSVTDSDGRAEAFGLATLEAQATGLPVVAFSSGGISETLDIEKSGYLIKEKDSDALAIAIEKLISDPEKRTQMGRDARQWVDAHFGTKKIQNQLIALMNKAMRKD